MRISIITPVFNKASMTLEFISSIAPYIDGCELIIIDNNSSDNTLSALSAAKRQYKNKNIKVFSHNKNAGFGGANNIGSKLAESEIVMFISNDVKIFGDVITPTVQYLLENSNTAVGPRLLNYDTGWNSFKEVSLIPYLEGFCFALNKRNFNLIQGFDENFFLDVEDLDLCYRLHLAGISLAQISLPLMHQLGGSFSELGVPRDSITQQSYKYFMQKWGLTRRD
jgi:GT2 family glycosyltransferase